MINYSLGVGLFSFLEAFLFVLFWFFLQLILLACCTESRLLKLLDGRRMLISSAQF